MRAGGRLVGSTLGHDSITAKLGEGGMTVEPSSSTATMPRGRPSFGISPTDGQIVVAAGSSQTDVLLAEGIPGIGATLPKRGKP